VSAARAYRGRPKSSATKFAGVSRLDYPDGGIAYRVRWKEGGGRDGMSTSETFDGLEEAP
jgi:hypothetical protein